jgi:hypothetical protein
VSIIKTSDDETAKKLITKYAQIKVQCAIEKDWKYFETVFKKSKRNTEKRLRDFVLDYNEETGCITLVDFTKFYAAIELFIVEEAAKGNPDVMDFCEQLIDYLELKLGTVKVDKRLLYAK